MTTEVSTRQLATRLLQLEKVLGYIVLHLGLGTKNDDGNVNWEPAGEETSLDKSRKRGGGYLVINRKHHRAAESGDVSRKNIWEEETVSN